MARALLSAGSKVEDCARRTSIDPASPAAAERSRVRRCIVFHHQSLRHPAFRVSRSARPSSSHFLPASHSPESVHAACAYARSNAAPSESSAGRASRCMATGALGSADLAL